jgi:Transcriptional regulator, AbiEi antitoxin
MSVRSVAIGAGTYTYPGFGAVEGTNTGIEGGEIEAFVAFFSDVRKKGDKPDPDALIAELAARQHGAISVAQLHSLEVSPAGIHRRVRANRLHPRHRGVYSVGHSGLSDEGRWMAAVLACGEGAVLSHTSAAALWGIRRRIRAVHVTVPSTAGKRKRAGVVLHRSSPFSATRSFGSPGARSPTTRPGWPRRFALYWK